MGQALLDIQEEQLTVLKKIHFWIRFWSVLGIIAALCAVIVYAAFWITVLF